ncbi:MAG TPA: alpha/beta fold hydrolase [Blastocatellia bacterium]|nr:alpha/beta fold hydrolase [Blastocatellia bacterium]
MKHLLRSFFVCLFVLWVSGLTLAQDGATRAEFECLMIANSSSAVAPPGAPAPSMSYHHVWTPGLSYGRFNSHGVNLMYETQGEGSEVVIVVHGGAGLPHEYFHPMLSNLSKYAKLVYFDRRADIQSAQHPERMASVYEMADDIDALRESLGLTRVTVLGHSFGGAIALNYALRHPENVKRLILVSASATIENPAEGERRIVKMLSPEELAAYGANEGGTGAAQPCERVRRRYSVLYPHYFHNLIPYEFDRGVYTAYYDALAKKHALAGDPTVLDVRSQLAEINVPALVLAGRYDPVTTIDQSYELASGLQRSKFVVMEHSAHFPFFEENYLFTQWVRQFMASTNDHSNERVPTRARVALNSGSR